MATKKEQLEQSQQALGDYFALSALLFGDNAPEDINQLPKDNPFYQTAKDIAEEMELDWENMSHTDSNRLMLNLLGEYYAAIQPEDEYYKPQLTVSYKNRKGQVEWA